MNPNETSNPWGQVVTKAWTDETFKNRLLSSPSAVFQEVGMEVPQGLQVRVVENTDQILHLTLPARPSKVQLESELEDSELDAVSGGLFAIGTPQTMQQLYQGWANMGEHMKEISDVVDPAHNSGH